MISKRTSVVLTEFFSIISSKISYDILEIKIRDDVLIVTVSSGEKSRRSVCSIADISPSFTKTETIVIHFMIR